MSSDKRTPPAPQPGLPPVTPPSGKFLVELFLVPGLIVGLIVCLLLGVNWLFSGARSPEAFLRRLADPNPEVRWRAASDLSQTLLRDPRLAADAGFALQLAERLQDAVAAAEPAERSFVDRYARPPAPERLKEWRQERQQERNRLEPDRNYIQFLCACLGNCTVPVGAPLLEDLAVRDTGAERAGLALRRRRAVWALANLGENLSRMRAEEQERALAGLDQVLEPFDALPAVEQRRYLTRREAER